MQRHTLKSHTWLRRLKPTPFLGRSDSIEPIYTFKNTHGDLFSFSGGKQVIKHLPRLTLLKPQQPVCFQYSPVAKDKNGFFLLTNLH